MEPITCDNCGYLLKPPFTECDACGGHFNESYTLPAEYFLSRYDLSLDRQRIMTSNGCWAVQSNSDGKLWNAWEDIADAVNEIAVRIGKAVEIDCAITMYAYMILKTTYHQGRSNLAYMEEAFNITFHGMNDIQENVNACDNTLIFVPRGFDWSVVLKRVDTVF